MKVSNFTGALLGSILIFTLIGYNLDAYFHTTPVFIVIGILYSIFGSFYLLVRKLKKNDESNAKKN